MGAIVGVATAVVAALFVGELGGLIDRLAVSLIRIAARAVPDEVRSEYRDDWYAELRSIGSGWAKLLFATSLGFHAFRIGHVVRKHRPRAVHEDKQRERRFFSRTVMILGLIASLLGALLVVLLTTTSLKTASISVADLIATIGAIVALNAIVIALVSVFGFSHRGDISVNGSEEDNQKERADS